jgi:hypothetical protein
LAPIRKSFPIKKAGDAPAFFDSKNAVRVVGVTRVYAAAVSRDFSFDLASLKLPSQNALTKSPV